MSLSTTPTSALTFTPISNLSQTGTQLGGAEITAFDPGTDRLFVTSNAGLGVIDLSNPAAPVFVTTLNLVTIAGAVSTDVASVAASNGVVAVAVQNPNKAQPGQVVFLDPATYAVLNVVTVGAHPDNIVFTPDGTRVLVANEGEFVGDNANDPGAEGSVSIIDISGGAANATVQTATFTAFNGQEDALRAEGVRLFQLNGANIPFATDVEPEYIAVSADGTRAMVTLQEANAVALLDIATATFTDIVALGTKDFSALLADFSDGGSGGGGAALNLVKAPVRGLYMPDAIASYEAGGQTYFVMANEGDDRDDFIAPNETIRVGNSAYNLDDATFPNEGALKANSALGRLTVSNQPLLRGDTDGDTDIDQILMYGARSFTIRDANGALVFDSADIIERAVAQLIPSQISLATFDDRSDNKGPEPEGITIGEIGGRTYAFVGLERANFTMVFDITNPAAVTYTGNAIRAGDRAPEGGLFVPAEDSPTGNALYIQSNEGVTNDGVTTQASVTVFEVEPTYTLQILHGSDFEAGLLAPGRAPNFAAIVQALEGTHANSITLSAGDNWIPGPFLAAGGDSAVRQALRDYYEQALGVTGLSGLREGAARVDVAIMNALGIQASALGNHEFDLGTNAVADAIDFTLATSGAGAARVNNIGAQFPYLSANLNFTPDGALSPLFTAELRDAASYASTAADFANDTAINAEAADRQISPWTTIQEGGETIGILGATTQMLRSISSPGNVGIIGGEGNNMAALAAVLQPYVDQMTAQGIDKIILLSHLQQYQFELELATLLTGVDVIIAGGSHAVFADGQDTLRPGDTAAQGYPVFRTGADGRPVAVVSTGGEYSYVGRLVLTFDADGVLIADPDGSGALTTGGVNPAVSGAFATTDAVVDRLLGNDDGSLSTAERDVIFADGTRAGEVRQLTDAVQGVIVAKDGNTFGYTDVFLDGRRAEVRTEETNLGNLSADANLWAARQTDPTVMISLKNGGGIRAEIGAIVGQPTPSEVPPLANDAAGKEAGEVSQLDIENSLRFNNGLSIVTFTAADLVKVIENALRGANPGATPGGFPQVSGLQFSFDRDRPAGDRLINMVVVDTDGSIVDTLVRDGDLVGDAARTFRTVALNFNLDGANGGDNWLNPAGNTDPALRANFTNRQDLFNPAAGTGFNAVGREQWAMAQYFANNFATPDTAFDVADVGPALDTRIQNVDLRADTVIPTASITTGWVTTTFAPDLVAGPLPGQWFAVDGTARTDIVEGTIGRDVIRLGVGSDEADGGLGDDSIAGEAGFDSLFGGAGDDSIDGGASDDSIAGGDGQDMLVGGVGDDSLQGGADADVLLGGLGRDLLEGGAGNDILEGGAAGDILFGGAGADRFRFTAEGDSFDNASWRLDVIEDFVRGQDRIELAFDANRLAGGEQDFVFTTGGFAFNMPGRVRVETVDGGVMVYANTDRDPAAEFALMVRGVTTLDAGDFIL